MELNCAAKVNASNFWQPFPCFNWLYRSGPEVLRRIWSGQTGLCAKLDGTKNFGLIVVALLSRSLVLAAHPRHTTIARHDMALRPQPGSTTRAARRDGSLVSKRARHAAQLQPYYASDRQQSQQSYEQKVK